VCLIEGSKLVEQVAGWLVNRQQQVKYTWEMTKEEEVEENIENMNSDCNMINTYLEAHELYPYIRIDLQTKINML
jgi:hypothetical protein